MQLLAGVHELNTVSLVLECARKVKPLPGVVFALLLTGMSLAHTTLIAVPFTFMGVFLLVFVLYRYGVLSLISALFFSHLNVFVPLTSEFSAWYAADFVLALIISLGIAVFAFYVSLAGQPLFRGAIPDE